MSFVNVVILSFILIKSGEANYGLLFLQFYVRLPSK